MIDRLIVHILEWAAGHHDEGRYSPVAIVFHWTMAALAAFQLWLGWWMGRLPVGGDKLAAYDAHYSLGVLMLLLALGRTSWRLLAPGPINDADKPGWQSAAAHVTHYIFYACLFGLPLSGWAMISATARDQAGDGLGVLPWPLLPFGALDLTTLWRIEAGAEWTHWGLVVTLILLVPIHVLAAVKHQLVDQDDVLHGMLPIIPEPRATASPAVRRLRALERRWTMQARRLWPRARPRSGRRRRSA